MRPSKTQIVLAVIVVGVAIFAGVRYYDDHHQHDEIAVVNPPRPGCDTVTIAASTEKAALLHDIADGYNHSNRTVGGKCFGVKVDAVASGTAETRLAAGWDVARGDAPDVWAPGSSTWLDLLRTQTGQADTASIVPTSAASLATSPLVIAMLKPMATALGWPGTPIGWSDLITLAKNPAGWAAKGHPEWGPFTMAKTNPLYSDTGLTASVAALDGALEQSVVSYGADPATHLRNQQLADDAGTPYSYADAFAIDEKSVLDYDAGNPTGDPKTLGKHAAPTVPLVAIYPKEGSYYSDNPYAVLNASWSTPARESAAKDFFDYLSLPAQQARFAAAGYRTATKQAGAAISASPDVQAAGVQTSLTTPDGAALAAAQTAWKAQRKPARVLLLMDVSGSMGESAADTGLTKLEQAKSAATAALSQFDGRDEVGVWQFSTGLPSASKSYQELVPVGSYNIDRTQLTNAIAGLAPLNGSSLYATVRAATTQLSNDVEAGHINSIVLLSNAKNNDPADGDQASLVAQLRSAPGIRVFSIGYGAGADLPALQALADASGGAFYNAVDPAAVDQAFAAAIANF